MLRNFNKTIKANNREKEVCVGKVEWKRRKKRRSKRGSTTCYNDYIVKCNRNKIKPSSKRLYKIKGL